MSIVLAIVVFSVIILFHEFGHFIIAKYNRVRVEEFSLGMGPRLISLVKTETGRKVQFLKSSAYFLEKHPSYMEHTVYSWKLLPFGGSCMMLGEEEEVEDESSFSKKSVYARMAIIFAGPFFNFILAFIFSMVIIIAMGYAKPEVTYIADDSAAMEAGMEVGDVIESIDGKKMVIDGDVSSYSTFTGFSEEEVEVVVERDGEEMTLILQPKIMTSSDGTEAYRIGINHGSREKVGPLATIKYSAYEMKYWISTTIKSLAGIITRKFGVSDVSGPVGIISAIGDDLDNSADESQGGGPSMVILNMCYWCVLLSANLGVMNLLPIPALDGGRLLFLIIEWIRRKPLNKKYEGYVNIAGFMLLMLLMVVVLGHDIFQIFAS